MTPSSSYFSETMLYQNYANVFARKDAEFTQQRPQPVLQIYRHAAAALSPQERRFQRIIPMPLSGYHAPVRRYRPDLLCQALDKEIHIHHFIFRLLPLVFVSCRRLSPLLYR